LNASPTKVKITKTFEKPHPGSFGVAVLHQFYLFPDEEYLKNAHLPLYLRITKRHLEVIQGTQKPMSA